MSESPLLKDYIDTSHPRATPCNTERQRGDGPIPLGSGKPVVQTYQVLGLQTQWILSPDWSHPQEKREV